MSRLVVCALCLIATVSAAQSPQIRDLEESFRAAASQEDKLRIAAELVRRGSTSPRYWTYLRAEAEAGLKEEAKAMAEWRKKHTKVDEYRLTASGRRPSSADQPRDSVDASTRVPQRPDDFGTSTTSSLREPTYSKTTSYSAIPRPADATQLPRFFYLSTTGAAESKQYLVRALSTDNPLLAAQGAMGLAKLGAKDMVATIAAAAIRFPNERILFAQALAYFNDAEADRKALDLVPDHTLYAQLQEVARATNYDPYPQPQP